MFAISSRVLISVSVSKVPNSCCKIPGNMVLGELWCGGNYGTGLISQSGCKCKCGSKGVLVIIHSQGAISVMLRNFIVSIYTLNVS